MKIRFVLNKKNHNLMKVLIDVNLDKFRIKSNTWRDSDRFRDYGDDQEEPPIFMKRLVDEIEGIESADFGKYDIEIMKGGIFSWINLTPEIIRILEAEVCDGKISSYSGAYCPRRQLGWLEEMLYSGDKKTEDKNQPSSSNTCLLKNKEEKRKKVSRCK
jgi:hypothetical protein